MKRLKHKLGVTVSYRQLVREPSLLQYTAALAIIPIAIIKPARDFRVLSKSQAYLSPAGFPAKACTCVVPYPPLKSCHV
jgi:hypothetical protein